MNNSTMDNKWSVDEETVNDYIKYMYNYSKCSTMFIAREGEDNKIDSIIHKNKSVRYMRIYTEFEGTMLTSYMITTINGNISNKELHDLVDNLEKFILNSKYIISYFNNSNLYNNGESEEYTTNNNIDDLKYLLNTVSPISYCLINPPTFWSRMITPNFVFITREVLLKNKKFNE